MLDTDPMEDTMSAVALDYAALDYAGAPGPVRMPSRPGLVLVPTGAAVAGHARLRPTRAARLIATVVVTLALAAALSVAAGAWGSAAPDPHSVTVRSGQTLSEIAARELPDLPVGTAVTRIQLANAMSSSQVDAGEVLVIPAAD